MQAEPGAKSSQRMRTVFDLGDFPGWGRFPELIDFFIESRPDFSVLDTPEADRIRCWAARRPSDSPYTLLDIDEAELAKAPAVYDRRICADATMPTLAFTSLVGNAAFDLVYSHMFLEHVTDADQVHRNIFAALRPGGFCVHAYPINNNIPLAINYVLPEALSRGVVRMVQPSRDMDGNVGEVSRVLQGMLFALAKGKSILPKLRIQGGSARGICRARVLRAASDRSVACTHASPVGGRIPDPLDLLRLAGPAKAHGDRAHLTIVH